MNIQSIRNLQPLFLASVAMPFVHPPLTHNPSIFVFAELHPACFRTKHWESKFQSNQRAPCSWRKPAPLLHGTYLERPLVNQKKIRKSIFDSKVAWGVHENGVPVENSKILISRPASKTQARQHELTSSPLDRRHLQKCGQQSLITEVFAKVEITANNMVLNIEYEMKFKQVPID